MPLYVWTSCRSCCAASLFWEGRLHVWDNTWAEQLTFDGDKLKLMRLCLYLPCADVQLASMQSSGHKFLSSAVSHTKCFLSMRTAVECRHTRLRSASSPENTAETWQTCVVALSTSILWTYELVQPWRATQWPVFILLGNSSPISIICSV